MISNLRIGGSATFNGITMINSLSGKVATAVRNNDGTITVVNSILYSKLTKFYQTGVGKFVRRTPVLREIIKMLTMLLLSIITGIIAFTKKNNFKEKTLAGKLYVIINIFLISIILVVLIFADDYIQFAILMVSVLAFRKNIIKMFKYHGAEHKCINMYESLGYLPENVITAQSFSRMHLRCGTNIFILLVPLLIVYSIVEEYFVNLTYNSTIEYWGILVIFGMGLELFQLFQNKRVNWILGPGLITQKYITTREPEFAHLEVAFVALEAVLD